MTAQTLDTENLLRRVIASVAQLPPNDLLVIYETINDLKQKDKEGKPALNVDEILSRARERAVDLRRLSRAELVQHFMDATERIRQDAIHRGVAIEGEWEND